MRTGHKWTRQTAYHWTDASVYHSPFVPSTDGMDVQYGRSTCSSTNALSPPVSVRLAYDMIAWREGEKNTRVIWSRNVTLILGHLAGESSAESRTWLRCKGWHNQCHLLLVSSTQRMALTWQQSLESFARWLAYPANRTKLSSFRRSTGPLTWLQDRAGRVDTTSRRSSRGSPTLFASITSQRLQHASVLSRNRNCFGESGSSTGMHLVRLVLNKSEKVSLESQSPNKDRFILSVSLVRLSHHLIRYRSTEYR